jgi:hypothetical protein
VSSWASTAPAAMANLAAMLTFWPDLAAVKVKDMGDLTDTDALAVLTVGYINTEEDSHAEATTAYGSLSGMEQREQYHIHCGLAVATGDEDGPGPCRQQAFSVLAAVGACLNSDQKLRGAVMNAQISTWSLRMDQTTGGIRAQINFDVAVDAFTSR